MLTQSTRKKISERNWLDIEKQDSNPSQLWRRLKDESIAAINDLILLANRLPDDRQREIFSPTRIDALIAQILDLGPFSQTHKDFNPRKSEIASRLVKRAIDLHINQYVNSSPETPSLNQPTIDHLKQAANICNDISYNMKLKNIHEKAEEGNYRYLFSWDNMYTREEVRLMSFVNSKTGGDYTQILSVQDKGRNERVVKFGIDTGDPEVGVEGIFQLTIDNTRTRAKACIFDVRHHKIWEDNDLLVEEVAKNTNVAWKNNLSRNLTNVIDFRNDFNFYIKKNDRSRKLAK